MTTPAETFAANLRRLRLERGMTQEGLALEAGLEQSDVGHIETLGREPRVTMIARLAKALGVDAGELFAGVDIPDD